MQDPMAGLFGGVESNEDKKGPEEGVSFETKDDNDKHRPENGQFDFKPNHNLTYVEAKAKLRSSKGWHEVSDWSETNLKEHFGGGGEHDHSAQYPGWSIDNYREWSKLLLSHNPDDRTLFGVEVRGFRLRYCPITGDFVKEDMAHGIITMFRPEREKDYYNDEVARYE